MTGHRDSATPSSDELDALCRRLTAFRSLRALLNAEADYRPSIRLDLFGREGAVLAKAYNRAQANRGDRRRAFITGKLPARSAAV